MRLCYTIAFPLVAILLATGCNAPQKNTAPECSHRDTLENTVWTSYHSNGVDILAFRDGRCHSRFYDAITGDVDQEDNAYRIVKNYIEMAGAGDTVRMYYEITAAGNTLTIYKSESDQNNNKPNVVFNKL